MGNKYICLEWEINTFWSLMRQLPPGMQFISATGQRNIVTSGTATNVRKICQQRLERRYNVVGLKILTQLLLQDAGNDFHLAH